MNPDNVVLFAGILAEAVVCGFVWKRKIGRMLPFFSTYVVWTLATDVAASLILWKYSLTSLVYHRYYLAETIVDSLLQFAVLVELAWSVLKPIRPSLPRGTLIVLNVLIALAGLAIWPLAGMALPPNMPVQNAVIFQSQEMFAILRVACFLIMASFSQLLAIGWRDRELQVATGLGFYSIVSLLVTLLHSQPALGTQYHWLDWAVSASYLGSLSYWVLSLATKEQERKEFSPQMQQILLVMGGGARSGRIALTSLPADRRKQKDK